MALLNTCKMWSNGIKIAFFFKNLQKSPSGWGLCPQTPIATGGWGLRAQTPICDTFECTSLLNTSPKLDISTSNDWFSPSHFTKILVKVPADYSFRSSILRYLCPTKSAFFWKVLMTSLHVICGLGPPNQKSWLRLWLARPFLPIKNPSYA